MCAVLVPALQKKGGSYGEDAEVTKILPGLENIRFLERSDKLLLLPHQRLMGKLDKKIYKLVRCINSVNNQGRFPRVEMSNIEVKGELFQGELQSKFFS